MKFSFKGNYTDLEDEKEIYPGSFTELGMKLEGRRKSDEKLLHDIEWMTIFKDMPGLYNQTFDTILEVLYQNKYHKVIFLIFLKIEVSGTKKLFLDLLRSGHLKPQFRSR